jgi:hypothetical protein
VTVPPDIVIAQKYQLPEDIVAIVIDRPPPVDDQHTTLFVELATPSQACTLSGE